MIDNKNMLDPLQGFIKISDTLAFKDVAGEPSAVGEYVIDDGCIRIEFTGEGLSEEDIKDIARDPYKAFGLVEKEKE